MSFLHHFLVLLSEKGEETDFAMVSDLKNRCYDSFFRSVDR